MSDRAGTHLPHKVVEGDDWPCDVQGRIYRVRNVVRERIRLEVMVDAWSLFVGQDAACLSVPISPNAHPEKLPTHVRYPRAAVRPVVVHAERHEPQHGDVEAHMPPRIDARPRVLQRAAGQRSGSQRAQRREARRPTHQGPERGVQRGEAVPGVALVREEDERVERPRQRGREGAAARGAREREVRGEEGEHLERARAVEAEEHEGGEGEEEGREDEVARVGGGACALREAEVEVLQGEEGACEKYEREEAVAKCAVLAIAVILARKSE